MLRKIFMFILWIGIISGCKNSIIHSIKYYDNGVIKEQTIYPDIHDTTIQKYYEYFPDGLLKRYIELSNNIWSGNVKAFFPNGNIKENLHFVNGIEHGVFRFYDSIGNKIQEYLFVEGQKLVYSELLINDSLEKYKYVYYDVNNDTAYYSGQLVFNESGILREETSDYYSTTGIDTIQLGRECNISVRSNIGCKECYIELQIENVEGELFTNKIAKSDPGCHTINFSFTPTKIGYDFIVGKVNVIEESDQSDNQILHHRDFTYYIDFVVIEK